MNCKDPRLFGFEPSVVEAVGAIVEQGLEIDGSSVLPFGNTVVVTRVLKNISVG